MYVHTYTHYTHLVKKEEKRRGEKRRETWYEYVDKYLASSTDIGKYLHLEIMIRRYFSGIMAPFLHAMHNTLVTCSLSPEIPRLRITSQLVYSPSLYTLKHFSLNVLSSTLLYNRLRRYLYILTSKLTAQ